MDEDDWRDRFRDEEVPFEPEGPSCGDCNRCHIPGRGFTTDPNIGWCSDCGEFVHLDWKADGECDSFVPN